MVSYRLPPWLVAWLRDQPIAASAVIEEALIKRHKLKAPTEKKDG
jgi:hypothetical protein